MASHDGEMALPTWLAYALKGLVTVSTAAILLGMVKVVKDFKSFLAQKVTIMILYITIVGALLLNVF